MRLTQVLYFLTTAKHLSFSEASRQLFIAQSAISKQISTLELELGMKLFERTNKSVVLTPAGEVLFRELTKLDDWLLSIINLAQQADSGMMGTLNIGILHGIDLFCPDITFLHLFSEAYPGIHLDLRRLTFREVEEDSNTGRSDITIIPSFLMPESGLQAYVLETNEDFLAVSKTGALGSKEQLTANDFKQETFITISPQISSQANMNSMRYLDKSGIHPINVKYVKTIEDMMLLVEAGLGYAVISNSTRLFNRDTIRIVDIYPTSLPRSTTDILAVWRKESINPAIMKYIEFVMGKKMILSPINN